MEGQNLRVQGRRIFHGFKQLSAPRVRRVELQRTLKVLLRAFKEPCGNVGVLLQEGASIESRGQYDHCVRVVGEDLERLLELVDALEELCGGLITLFGHG